MFSWELYSSLFRMGYNRRLPLAVNKTMWDVNKKMSETNMRKTSGWRTQIGKYTNVSKVFNLVSWTTIIDIFEMVIASVLGCFWPDQMSQDGRRGQYLFVNGSQQQQKQRSGAINVEIICFFFVKFSRSNYRFKSRILCIKLTPRLSLPYKSEVSFQAKLHSRLDSHYSYCSLCSKIGKR